MAFVRIGIEPVRSDERESMVTSGIHLERVVRAGFAERLIDSLGFAGNDVGIEFGDRDVEFRTHAIGEKMWTVRPVGGEICTVNRGGDGDAIREARRGIEGEGAAQAVADDATFLAACGGCSCNRSRSSASVAASNNNAFGDNKLNRTSSHVWVF